MNSTLGLKYLRQIYMYSNLSIQHVFKSTNTVNAQLRSTVASTVNVNVNSTKITSPRITSEEYEKFGTEELLRHLNSRTCVSTTLSDFINKKVTLYGWIENCKNGESFCIVDGYGRFLCSKENPKIQNAFHHIKPQDLVVAHGCVVTNSESNVMTVILDSIKALNSNSKDANYRDTPQTNTYTSRTHNCGELRYANAGEVVTLCGWLQYQRMNKFLLLRDSYGMTQCVVTEHSDMSNIPLESVLKVTGTVTARPADMVNPAMATGDVEVIIDSCEVLNLVEDIPFTLRKHQKPKEQLRLQYRYVDLRYPEMQNNLRLRSQMLHRMRKYLIEGHAFIEVETPTLFCRTPGGAREFVVPTHHPGLFYSLVQSPQQFKQMLMVGGVDRYFQVARCYRDESTRPDRQPEFTQLDIELSFTTVDGILKLIEDLLYLTYPVPMSKPPFRRITYKEALETYGSDKPDLTYDLKLNNITLCLENINCVNDFSSYALTFSDCGKLSNKTKEAIKLLKKQYPKVQTLDYSKLRDDVQNNIASKLQLDGSLKLYIAAGPCEDTCLFLGEIRMLLAQELIAKGILEVNLGICEPCWIVDFPLFVRGENGDLETCHHPFTAPHPDDVHLIDSEPLKVRSLAYDLVINGNEVGGGSVRAHNPDLQAKLLNILNIDGDKMGHFVKALRSGCPPHAGIALGIDRMMALACNAESIRDVIAFPKSHEGRDPLSGAPNCISDDDKHYYHLAAKNITDRSKELQQ